MDIHTVTLSHTEPSLLAANTNAGELRWCKHEEGLMILILPMDGSPPQLLHRERENTIVVAGCAPYEIALEEAALEESVGAWPARGP
jgi:hypothetical protein